MAQLPPIQGQVPQPVPNANWPGLRGSLGFLLNAAILPPGVRFDRLPGNMAKRSWSTDHQLYDPFKPRVGEADIRHSFLGAYGGNLAPELPTPNNPANGLVRAKDEIFDACESQIDWIASCLTTIGRRRTIGFRKKTYATKPVEGIPLKSYGDFVFDWYGCEGSSTMAVLIIKAVGGVDSSTWEGDIHRGTQDPPVQWNMTSDIREVAVFFKTRIIMCFDGRTLLRVRFGRDSDLENDEPEHIYFIRHDGNGQDGPSFRSAILHGVCEGLDMVNVNWWRL